MKDNYNPANYITQKETCEILKVSLNTLSRYLNAGKIRRYKINARKVLCNKADVYRMINLPMNSDGMNVIYARVSKQCDIEKLREQEIQVSTFAVKNGIQIDKIYSDISPSYNFKQQKRPAFFTLLKDINKYKI